MILFLVEGDGEKRSVPILVQRIVDDVHIRCIGMYGKANIVRAQRGFEDTIRRKHALGDRSFVVLIDADVTYLPYLDLTEEHAGMVQRAQTLSAELDVHVEVCWAIKESESWLIGGLLPRVTYCGLRNIGRIPNDTETNPPDPKRWLQDKLNSDYNPERQACLSGHIDVEEAQRHNSSMRLFFQMVSRMNRE
jgi:hypothetical protein